MGRPSGALKSSGNSEGKKWFQTWSESAADLKHLETADDRQTSRGEVKERILAMQSSGRLFIALLFSFYQRKEDLIRLFIYIVTQFSWEEGTWKVYLYYSILEAEETWR